MGCLAVCREEFRLHKLGFGGVESDRFYTFLWRQPPIVYLIYRFVLAAYTLTILIYTASITSNPYYPWPVYLTNWSYTILTLYMVTHFLATLVHFCSNHNQRTGLIARKDKDCHRECILGTTLNNTLPSYQTVEENEPQTEATSTISPYLIIVWILFDIISPAALMVTGVFWVTIYPTLNHSSTLGTDNIQLHILNTVIILLEHCLTAIPFRLLHVIFPFIYALVYCLFSAIFWAGDHHRVIYPILDWNTPGETFGIALLIGFALIPTIHIIFFLIYQLKLFIFRKL